MWTINQHPNDEYDIDVALVFKKHHLPDDAFDSRERIAKALQKVGGNFAKEPEARTNAVTIWYADGYHIDFAIYREYTDDIGVEKIEHAGANWSARDPQEVTEWFEKMVAEKSPKPEQGATVEKEQMRRIVRLVKKFARSRDSWSLPGGLIISTLVDESFRPDLHRDDMSLEQTLRTILTRLSLSEVVYNPVDRTQLLTNKDVYLKQVKRFKKRIADAIRKLEVLHNPKCTKSDARSAWEWLFQHEFWKTQLAKSATEFTPPISAEVLSTNQLFSLRADVSKKQGGKYYTVIRIMDLLFQRTCGFGSRAGQQGFVLRIRFLTNQKRNEAEKLGYSPQPRKHLPQYFHNLSRWT